MIDETTTEPNVMAGDVITQPGLYQSRGGDIMPIIGWGDGWWVSELNGTRDWYGSDGRQRFDGGPEPNEWQLLRWVGPLPTSEAEPETTTEQLAEIEGQAEPVQVREGRWKTRGGDIRNVTPTPPGHDLADDFPWWDGSGTFCNDGRYAGFDKAMNLVTYLGPIESQPEPEPEPQPESDDEMRIRLLEEASIRRVEIIGHMQQELQQAQAELAGAIQSRDLFAEANRRQADKIAELQNRIADLETSNAAQKAAIQDKNAKLRERADEFRSEVSYTQNLLGESRQRVTHLEELVTSLRTINDAQEQAVERANRETEKFALQWRVAKAELTTAASVCQQLQIELDAAQQVPADSPELRQLRLDLAEVTRDRDEYRHAHGLLVQDANTAHERTRAMTVEAIIEWLEPFRNCNSPSLALLLLEALPDIMRSLTGLNTREEIE